MSNNINSITKTEAVVSALNTIALLSLFIEKDLGRTDPGSSVFIYFDSVLPIFVENKLGT